MVRRHLSPGWLAGHGVALVLFISCLALGWWQVTRAGEGNISSYAYAVEWPVFAGFVAFVWYREVRRAARQPDTVPAGDRAGAPAMEPAAVAAGTQVHRGTDGRDRSAGSGRAAHDGRAAGHDRVARDGRNTGEPDDELAAYNRMLAWLNANPGRRMSDYPG